RALWAAALLSPLVVPGVAAGLGFLILAAGLGLLRSRSVLIAAHVALVLPFVVRSVWVSVRNLDPALERAAASLGATPGRAAVARFLPRDPAAPSARSLRRAPLRGGGLGQRVRRLALHLQPRHRDPAGGHVHLRRELHRPHHRRAVQPLHRRYLPRGLARRPAPEPRPGLPPALRHGPGGGGAPGLFARLRQRARGGRP